MIIENSLYDEKLKPRINDSIPIKNVEPKANRPTVISFEAINSFLLKPSIRFCFKVPYVYSLAVIETITTAKKIFRIAAIYVLKCQINGKLKIPWSAILNSTPPIGNFIEAMSAINESNTK